MIKNIASNLEKYNDSKQIVDKAYIDRICLDLVDHYGLHKYLRDVRLKKFGKSEYNVANKILYMKDNRDRKYLSTIKREFGEDFYYWYNLFETMVVLHEMEHVHQEPLKREKFNTMESRLVFLNDILDYADKEGSVLSRALGIFRLARYGHYYSDNHDLAPIERLANIRSYEGMFKILNEIDKYDIETVKIFEAHVLDLLVQQILCGYELQGDKTNDPSIDFLLGMKHPDVEHLVLHSGYFNGDSYSLKDRVTYGLSISKDEYEDVQDYKKVYKLFHN